MTKIKNYELDSTINDDDKVIGTDGLPGADFGRTKNYSIASLVNYIDNQLDPVDGSGTLNTIPIWTPDGDTLGDSIMTYDTGTTTIAVGGGLGVTGDLSVTGGSSLNGGGSSSGGTFHFTDTSPVRITGTLLDGANGPGTMSQLLSSTGTGLSWIDAPVTGVTGSGTVNTLAMFTPDGESIGDSIVAVTGGGTKITVTGGASITGNVGISGNLDVTLVATFEDDISVGEGLLDASDSPGTANQILTSTGTRTSWQDLSALVPNNITGSGTVEYIPKFTPDGTAIGNSVMFTKPNGLEIQVGVSGATETTLGAGFVSTGGVGADTVTATNINAGSSGTLTASGNIILGDATADTTTINSTLSILSVVKDSTDTVGTVGQVLVANAASELLWEDQVDTDTTYAVTSLQSGSDVQVILTGSDATETEVTLVAGADISIVDDGANGVTINATGGAANTTYQLNNTQASGSVSLELDGSDGSLTDYVLLAGTGVSFDNSVAGTTSIGIAADNVTGTGTLNKLPLWTPDGQTLGDSVVFQDSNQGIIVAGSGAAANDFRVQGIASTVQISSTLGTPKLQFDLQSAADSIVRFDVVDASGGNAAKYIWTKGVTEYMRLDTADGRVGIGTTTPISKLDVDGDYIAMNGIPFVKQFSGTDTIYLGDVASNGQNVELVSDTDTLVILSGNILELGNSTAGTQVVALAPIWVKAELKDVSSSYGTAGQVLSSTGANVQWVGPADIGFVAGSGTLDVIPLWTPDGDQLGDSHISQTSTQVSIGTTLLPKDFLVTGNTIIGDTSADNLTIEATAEANSRFSFNDQLNVSAGLYDGGGDVGTSGQILSSTGTLVDWVDYGSLIGGLGTVNHGVLWGQDGTLTTSLLRHGSGADSVGLGLNNDTQGQESMAFTRSTAKANFSFALGYETITDGEFSVALGKGGYAAGEHAMATNYKGMALGRASLAGGWSSGAGGDGSIALGHNASAGNYGAAKLVSTLPNGQTVIDIQGIVGTVAVGTFMRYGEGLDTPDPRFLVTAFVDNGNNSATITISSPGIRPIQGELVVFEEQIPFRGDHQGGIALGNDSFSLGEGTVSIGHNSVAEADKAVALGDDARSTGVSSVAIGKGSDASTDDTIALGGDSTKILITALRASSSYVDDAAAAAGGVGLGQLYRNGSIVQIRIT